MPLWLAVALLGIIEGITEFIPVSSTGHLLLAENWLPRQTDLFNIVIQCGAVLAVLPLFPERLKQFFTRWREPATQDYLLKILLALLLGLNRVAATEFSFLVGIPTMLAAGALKIFKAVHHPSPDGPHENWAMVALGFIIAAVVSFIAVRWLLRYVQSHTFVVFGW